MSAKNTVKHTVTFRNFNIKCSYLSICVDKLMSRSSYRIYRDQAIREITMC